MTHQKALNGFHQFSLLFVEAFLALCSFLHSHLYMIHNIEVCILKYVAV